MGNSDYTAVMNIMQAYMTATFEGDITGFKDIFHESIVMNGYLGDQLIVGNADMFLAQMGDSPSLKSSGAPYKGQVSNVSITNDVASATILESGFGDMSFINYFNLVKINGIWKITSKTFSTI